MDSEQSLYRKTKGKEMKYKNHFRVMIQRNHRNTPRAKEYSIIVSNNTEPPGTYCSTQQVVLCWVSEIKIEEVVREEYIQDYLSFTF